MHGKAEMAAFSLTSLAAALCYSAASALRRQKTRLAAVPSTVNLL